MFSTSTVLCDASEPFAVECVCVASLTFSVWYVVLSGQSQHLFLCVLAGRRVSCVLGAKLLLFVFFHAVGAS